MATLSGYNPNTSLLPPSSGTIQPMSGGSMSGGTMSGPPPGFNAQVSLLPSAGGQINSFSGGFFNEPIQIVHHNPSSNSFIGGVVSRPLNLKADSITYNTIEVSWSNYDSTGKYSGRAIPAKSTSETVTSDNPPIVPAIIKADIDINRKKAIFKNLMPDMSYIITISSAGAVSEPITVTTSKKILNASTNTSDINNPISTGTTTSTGTSTDTSIGTTTSDNTSTINKTNNKNIKTKDIILFGIPLTLENPDLMTDENFTESQITALKQFGLDGPGLNFKQKKEVIQSLFDGKCNTDQPLIFQRNCEPIRRIVQSLALNLLSKLSTEGNSNISTIKKEEQPSVEYIKTTEGGMKICITFKPDQLHILSKFSPKGTLKPIIKKDNLVATGATGATGTTDAIRATGATGTTDNLGASGIIGTTGTTGETNNLGAIGATGITNNLGAIGATGATNNLGANRETGATGITDNLGAFGIIGASGATGTTDNLGATGATGITDNLGANRATGATGAINNLGATGTIGTIRTTNNLGATGATGATGANSLTEDEINEILSELSTLNILLPSNLDKLNELKQKVLELKTNKLSQEELDEIDELLESLKEPINTLPNEERKGITFNELKKKFNKIKQNNNIRAKRASSKLDASENVSPAGLFGNNNNETEPEINAAAVAKKKQNNNNIREKRAASKLDVSENVSPAGLFGNNNNEAEPEINAAAVAKKKQNNNIREKRAASKQNIPENVSPSGLFGNNNFETEPNKNTTINKKNNSLKNKPERKYTATNIKIFNGKLDKLKLDMNALQRGKRTPNRAKTISNILSNKQTLKGKTGMTSNVIKNSLNKIKDKYASVNTKKRLTLGGNIKNKTFKKANFKRKNITMKKNRK